MSSSQGMGAYTGPRCGAKTRSGGECRRVAGHGTDHPGVGRCSYHAGATPNGRIAAARALATRETARLGLAVDATPDEALQLCLQMAMADVEFISRNLAALGEDGQIEDGKLHPLGRTLIEVRDHLAKLAKVAIDAGIEQRRLELDELEVKRIAGAIRLVFNEIDLTPEQHRQALEAVARALPAALDGGQA